MMRRKTVKVSVIIPALNEERFIKSTLEALRRQRYSSFETIVVDGGSTDQTAKIAEDYGASVLFFRRIDLKRRSVAAQRNLGVAKAEGEILAFTDADTLVPSSWLYSIVEKFERDPELVALSGRNSPFNTPLYLKVEYALYDLLRYVLSRLPGLSQRFLAAGYNFAIRKRTLVAVGGFDESLEKNVDGELGRRLRVMGAGKARVFLNLIVSTSIRRFRALGFWKFHAYYLYILENIVVTLPKYKFWRELVSLFDRYILLKY